MEISSHNMAFCRELPTEYSKIKNSGIIQKLGGDQDQGNRHRDVHRENPGSIFTGNKNIITGTNA
jgi:hypothetical protein